MKHLLLAVMLLLFNVATPNNGNGYDHDDDHSGQGDEHGNGGNGNHNGWSNDDEPVDPEAPISRKLIALLAAGGVAIGYYKHKQQRNENTAFNA